jgi:hypothetical protein
MKDSDVKMLDRPTRGACFGFSGPDDRVVSLNVPAMNENGQEDSIRSFDIEYDPDQPDRLVICLLELDQDNFVRATRTSIAFPASLLADLVSKRKATPQEIASWQAASDEDE